MAWRLHEYIVRGQIDNRIRGRVTGRIWLEGVEEPLVLELMGDCQPDLAGCLLTFVNPNPQPFITKPPAPRQIGRVGTITAARKARVFDVPIEEALAMGKRGEKAPEHLANCLFVEWESDLSGRIVIESADYDLDISDPEWRFSADEIAEFARGVSGEKSLIREIRTGEEEDREDQPWDEFRCEQLLRESDLTGEKYRRLLEKYADHPDQDRIIAHEMGWKWLEDALNETASCEPDDDGEFEIELAEGELEEESEPDPAREGIDWVRDETDGDIVHPTAKHLHDVLYALLRELRAGESDLADTDEAIGAFVGHFMTLSVKLSAALEFIARGGSVMDRGLVIAWLKRALELHNETLAASENLPAHPLFPVDRQEYYRSELFRVREAVLAIIAELRAAL